MPVVPNLLTFFNATKKLTRRKFSKYVGSVLTYLSWFAKRVIHVLAKPSGGNFSSCGSTLPSLSGSLALNGLFFGLCASQSQAGISFILDVGLLSFVSSISFAIEILLTFINKVFHILSSISLPPNLSQIFWGLSENDSHC